MIYNLNQMIDPWLALRQKTASAELPAWELPNIQSYPKVNLYSQDDNVFLTTELPGLVKTDIDLKVKGDTLFLSAKPTPNKEEAQDYIFRERGGVAFERAIKFNFTIDADQVNGVYENGVLTVTLAPVPSEQPKTIVLT